MFASPMQVTVQRISPVVMELQIEVPADAVKTEVEKAYSNLAKKAHVKGFRPGKAPRSVLTHLYGPRVQNDVASALVNETLPKVLTDNNVSPIGQPSVEAGAFSTTEPFIYKARCEVQPEIGEVKYEGFELYRPKLEVDRRDGRRAARVASSASLDPQGPRAAAPRQEGRRPDHRLHALGRRQGREGRRRPRRADRARRRARLSPSSRRRSRARASATRSTAEVDVPRTHQRVDLRGKKATFHITVVDLKERILPTLDDELAKDVGQFDTLVALRADIHTKLTSAFKDQADTAVAEQIVDKLNVANPLDVPPTLVQQQCQMMEMEMAAQARRMGQRFTQEGFQRVHAQIHADAEKKVRAGLLMAAIAKKNDLKVSDEDIEKGYVELAEQTGKNVAKVKAEYREKSKRDVLHRDDSRRQDPDLPRRQVEDHRGRPAQGRGREG